MCGGNPRPTESSKEFRKKMDAWIKENPERIKEYHERVSKKTQKESK